MSECCEESRVSVGAREAFGEIYRHLGWEQLLGARRNSSNRIIKELVLARIAHPRSKHGIVLDLCADAGVTLNLDRVYQAMDFIDEARIDAIQRQSHARAKELFSRPIEVLFYDTTTLYFESEIEDEPSSSESGLRFKGYSKDGKPQRTQVLLALLVTDEGIPLGYELSPGNTYEGDTLIGAIERVSKSYVVKRFTVVADSGLLSQNNQQLLEERGIPYILGFRMKLTTQALKRKILHSAGFEVWDGDPALSETVSRYKVIEHQGRRIVVSYSDQRARKDRRNRAQAIARLHRKLKKSQQACGRSESGLCAFPGVSSRRPHPHQSAQGGRGGKVGWAAGDHCQRQ